MVAPSRITHDPKIMGGKPCIRGLRVTVGTVVGLVEAGHSAEEILRLYPYLEAADIPEALAYDLSQMEPPQPLTQAQREELDRRWKIIACTRRSACRGRRSRGAFLECDGRADHLSTTMHASSDIMKTTIITILTFLLMTAVITAAEPIREDGLSVHMLPDSVAKTSGEHGGFTVTDPSTKEHGATYAEPKELLAYVQHLPAPVQQSGIWVVLTNPISYSDSERHKLKVLTSLCDEKKIPLYTCRASELPKGWQRAKQD